MTTRGRKGGKFAQMSREDLVTFCRSLYGQQGIEALSYPSLRKHQSLYANLYRARLSQKELLAALGLESEYRAHKDSLPLIRQGGRASHRWTWTRIVDEAGLIRKQHSQLPPAAWFQANGYGSLVKAIYKQGKSWESLRDALGDFKQSSFVESRNGMRWRSHPEASLSNFLYARGIEHKRGKKYPDDYANHSTAKYAYYDLHLISKTGEWIDIEIWGDKPYGHSEQRYSEKRREKEAYHSGRKSFVGIHFNDCYSDDKLSIILEPVIGLVKPFLFDKPTDNRIQSTHWSNADELLDDCCQLAESMPDGKFPTEGWLRKRGKWAGRSGDSLNTMSVYIKLWLGGVRKLRSLLGQGHQSTTVWSEASAISAYKEFHKTHGITAQQYRHRHLSGDKSTSPEVARIATNICHAVHKYSGGTEALNSALGILIDRTRRWSKEAVLNGYRQIIEQWGVSPHQLWNDQRTGKMQLDDGVARDLGKLIGVTRKHFTSSREIYDILGFKLPSRPRKRRSKKAIAQSFKADGPEWSRP